MAHLVPHTPACSAPGAGILGVRSVSVASMLVLGMVVIARAVPVLAAPVLREATIQVTFTAPTACDVDASYTVVPPADGSVHHRLQTLEGTAVEMRETSGLQVLGAPRAVGRTYALDGRLQGSDVQTYTLRYRVAQTAPHEYRCPLWLPTIPADGISRAVRVGVRLPSGASPIGGGFPALRWDAGNGTATLSHVPAFLLVPFAVAGDARASWTWNITRTMDAAAILLLAAGMLTFVWRSRRR